VEQEIFHFFTLVRYVLIAVRTKSSMVWSWYSYCCVRVLQQTCLPLVLADSSRAFRGVRGLGVEKHWFKALNKRRLKKLLK